MTRTRDPEAKKRRLLDAALDEFAANGFSTTSTDSIGRRAECSAGLIYTYFGSKEGLFSAAFDEIVIQVNEAVPFTPEDLSGYAVRLFDFHESNPRIKRLAQWHILERDRLKLPGTLTPRETIDQVAEMDAALKAGRVSSDLDAGQLVLLVQNIALSWMNSPPDLTKVVAATDDMDRRRETISAAVMLLLN